MVSDGEKTSRPECLSLSSETHFMTEQLLERERETKDREWTLLYWEM